MRHRPTPRLTPVDSGASHTTRINLRSPRRAQALFGLTLALLGAGQVTGCLATVDEEEELALESTVQAIECGSEQEKLAQGVLGILGAIPIIGEFVSLPASVSAMAISLTCSEAYAESRADVAGIARDHINQAELRKIEVEADTINSELDKEQKDSDETTPSVASLHSYALMAAVMEARALDLGFIAVDSWMAASAIRLGALRAKLDAQTSALAAHNVVEELRSAVQLIQGEAVKLEDALNQHRNGVSYSFVSENGANRYTCRPAPTIFCSTCEQCFLVSTTKHTGTAKYPKQSTGIVSTTSCDGDDTSCRANVESGLKTKLESEIAIQNQKISDSFYTANYAAFKEGLTKILSGLDAWNARNNLAAGKPTSQSTTAFEGASRRAVDGNRDGVYSSNSVTHTANELEPYWEVDLGRTQRIEGVVLYSRTDDCCSGLLSDLDIKLYNDEHVQVDFGELKGANGPSRAYSINGGTGGNQARFVRVQIRNIGTYRSLQLAEVYVYGMNRARGRPTTQRTTDYEGTAERAVNGRVNGHYADRGVTHTSPQKGMDKEYWEVDLGAIRKIGDVLLWNRTDCCKERLGGLRVTLIRRTRSADSSFDVPSGPGIVVGDSASVWTGKFDGLEGNVLRVETQTAGQLVSLAEVEVFEQFTNMRSMPNTPAVYSREFDARSDCRLQPGIINDKGYELCVMQRSENFSSSDPAWIAAVRSYCVDSQVALGGGYNNVSGYQQCLSERSVPFVADAQWCRGVSNYCEQQWYPFGGKSRCYWERGCSY